MSGGGVVNCLVLKSRREVVLVIWDVAPTFHIAAFVDDAGVGPATGEVSNGVLSAGPVRCVVEDGR